MSRLFALASSQYANTTGVVTVAPVTFAAWVYQTTNAAQQTVIAVQRVGGGSPDYFALHMIGGGTVQAEAQGGGFSGTSTTSATLSTATWGHIAAVFSATNNRVAYLNAVGATANTASVTPNLATASTTIGALDAGSITFPLDGRAAECGIWNVALGADELTTLAAGISPLQVRPSALVGYWPLFGNDSPEPDWNPAGNGNVMALNAGPVYADHAPVVPYWMSSLGPTAHAVGFTGPLIAPVGRRFTTPSGTRSGTRQLQQLP